MNRTHRPGSVPPAAVFLDPSGRRKRWSRLLFYVTLAGFAAYVGLLAASLIGDPRLAVLAPRGPAGNVGRRLVYRPPAPAAADSRAGDAATTSPAGAVVPDYAAALAGITLPSAARSRPAAPASAAPVPSNPDPTGAVRPAGVTVTTTIRSSDWPVTAVYPDGRPTPPTTTSPTSSARPSAAPSTTTATTAPGQAAPPPTTTPTTTTPTTTAPDPAPTTPGGGGPDGHGPRGLLRRWAASLPTN